MRYIVVAVWVFAAGSGPLEAQLFPVQVEGRWGLMDTTGQYFLPTAYDAISDPDEYGYMTVRQGERVSLLNRSGEQILPARYADIQPVRAGLFAVRVGEEWQLVDEHRRVLLRSYERIELLPEGLLAFRMHNAWGLLRLQDGKVLHEPTYDGILPISPGYLIIRSGAREGIMRTDGQVLLPAAHKQVKLLERQRLITYREGYRRVANDFEGRTVISEPFEVLDTLGEHFVQVKRGQARRLYSTALGKEVGKPRDAFYPMDSLHAKASYKGKLGLMMRDGTPVLPHRYDEILPFAPGLYRVRQRDGWGLTDTLNREVVAPTLSYIAPRQGPVAIFRMGRYFGLLNYEGRTVLPATYDRIDLVTRRAYRGKSLTILNINRRGEVAGDDIKRMGVIKVRRRASSAPALHTPALDEVEWYYQTDTRKWGLRSIHDGLVLQSPQFDKIEVFAALGVTLVGTYATHSHDLGGTALRPLYTVGLVDNTTGELITRVPLLDIRMSDYASGLPYARVITTDGRHALLARSGELRCKGYAYIGTFRQGVAPVSLKGELTTAHQPGDISLARVQQYAHQYYWPVEPLEGEMGRRLLYCRQGRWGYVDTLGKMVVPPAYDMALPFAAGLGVVHRDGKWGAVDTTAALQLPCRYDDLEAITYRGRRVLRTAIDDERYGLLDTTGAVAVAAVWHELGELSEGLLPVRRGSKWGFVDAHGRQIIPCTYSKVQPYSEGKAAALTRKGWSFIDRAGKPLLDTYYSRVGNYIGGLAYARTGDGYGYLDTTGAWVVGPTFERAWDFEGEVARVQVDGSIRLLHRGGYFVNAQRYDQLSAFDGHGLAVARKGDQRLRYYLVDKSGQRRSRDYESIRAFRAGIAAVRKDGRWGYIDTAGVELVVPRYSRVSGFSEGRAWVQLDGKCGFIDRQGRPITEMAFSKCLDYEDGHATVYQNARKGGVLDYAGNYVIAPSLDRLVGYTETRGLLRDQRLQYYYITDRAEVADGYYEEARLYEHGLARVRQGSLWGLLDQQGAFVVSPRYDNISAYEGGFARVRLRQLQGLTAADGTPLADTSYEAVDYLGYGVFRLSKGGRMQLLHISGAWLLR